jgi:glutamate-1-semialdehyde aminotransferase
MGLAGSTHCIAKARLTMTYPDVQSLSKALYERAKRSLPGGNTRGIVYMDPYPIYAARGSEFRPIATL